MKISKRTRPSAAIPLVSTADVAFLLLIFFIVLAKNANESSVEWRPAVTQEELVDAKDILCSIIVDKQSNVFVNGQPSSVGALKETVAEYLGNRQPGERKVLLKIDKEVPERVYGPVLLAVTEGGGELFRALDPPKGQATP